MFRTFEEIVFQSTQKQSCSTMIKIESTKECKNKDQECIQEIENQGYMKAIETLNTLQKKVGNFRLPMNHLEDTCKYLLRSGLTLVDLTKCSYIHVSGTKGKGSTCALTESILRAYGLKTGLYSSPHLVSVTERIRINNEPISKEKFTKYFCSIYEKLHEAQNFERDMPGYFQILTILTFHVFLDENVDVAILETGIGGELDCTNIVPNTKTVGITSIGLEHTNHLGNTLPEIAWQKAGIIKAGSTVYTSVTQEECIKIIRDRCKEKHAAHFCKVPDFKLYFQDENDLKLTESFNNVVLLNGSLAIQLAYDWLRQNRKDMRNEINATYLTQEVMKGLINCHWPGRCQKINYFNLNMHLDAAHTLESMEICGSWFSQVTRYSQKPKILIFNITGNRDPKKLLKILKSFLVFDLICFVPNLITTNATGNTPDTTTTTATHKEQMERSKMYACHWELLCVEDQTSNYSKVFPSVISCFQYIQDQFDKSQQLDILVTGSPHLLGVTILSLNEFYKNNL
uniref:Folylpolyglutamate synthase n=1 Tax=Glossina brevipalpis TaxID=37001 RepID=A0A1A9W3R9_9MUSC